MDKIPEISKVEHKFTSLDQNTGNVTVKDVDASVHDTLNTPKTHSEAVTGPEKQHWIPSMRDEMKSLVGNHTWDMVRKPKGTKLVSAKWAFRKKMNPDGSMRCKSRMVARGFNQRKGVDWFRSHAHPHL